MVGLVVAVLMLTLAACNTGASAGETGASTPAAVSSGTTGAASIGANSGVAGSGAGAPVASAGGATGGAAGGAVAAPAASGNGASGATAGQAAAPASGDFTTAVRRVTQQITPAVVQITNEQVQVDQFNQPLTVPAGVGSGVLYDNQGHILTNNHVIAGAQRLTVSLPDGRSFQGNVIGGDPQTDLAVVQISGDNLPVAPVGRSADVQVGDWVVAIGNALGLPGGPTVTAGVASAVGRTVQEPSDSGGAGPLLFDVIQTSAPINPGNSGGPLLNLAGEVVGINTLVAGQAEPGVPAQGIGFAIAIDTAKPIADELVANGRVVHPFLGIQYGPLNPAIARQLGIQQTEGVLVGRVVAGSPAAQAGLQARDVITAINGQPIKGDTDLAKSLNGRKPGDRVALSVARGSQTTSVNATLGEMPTP